MRYILSTLIIVLLSLNAMALSFNADVSYVIDGDTFKTKQGQTVRLLGINTPEIGRNGQNSQPFAQAARKELTQTILNKTVTIQTNEQQETDKYGRILGFIYTENGENINESMLKKGLAHVYTFPDTPFNPANFFAAEKQARTQKTGLWSIPRWHVRNTDDSFDKNSIGKFQLTKGVVKNVKTVRDKIYLNFGEDWRTDFTVEINKKHWKNFEVEGIDPHTFYNNKNVLVRGFYKPVNGILVSASHPAQIEIIK